MTVVVRETETKFTVPEGFRVPDLASVGPITDVEGPEQVELSAVYFDTADLRLAREGITLRRRTGGDDAGWHLKLPVRGSASRDEVRLPLSAGQGPSVPAELADLVVVYSRRDALEAVATLQTDRTVYRLRSSGGVDVAEVALDEVTVLGVDASADDAGDQAGARIDTDTDADRAGVAGVGGLGRFTELEVELAGGENVLPPGLDDVIRVLRTAGATATAQFVPKLVRALGPTAQAGPDVPAPTAELSGDSPAADLVRAHIATQVRALRVADVGVRRGQEDAVHQMRVAARRLRSGLRVFRPLLDRAWADDLRAELAWLAGELGGARDGEVLTTRLHGAVAALPAEVDAAATVAFLDRRLGKGVAHGQAAALAAVRSERYLTLVDRLVGAATSPSTTAAAHRSCVKALPPLVAKVWRRLQREADALRLDGVDDDWHEVRKSAKAARYAAEAVAPALGKPAKRLARQVERVTELLGAHQDAAVAATTLIGLAATPRIGARTAFGLGVLYTAQRDDVRTARQDFLRAWPQVAQQKHRKWLKRKR